MLSSSLHGKNTTAAAEDEGTICSHRVMALNSESQRSKFTPLGSSHTSAAPWGGRMFAASSMLHSTGHFVKNKWAVCQSRPPLLLFESHGSADSRAAIMSRAVIGALESASLSLNSARQDGCSSGTKEEEFCFH